MRAGNTNTLILGIGNTLLRDEGAGVHALEHFRSNNEHLDNITYVDGGTLSFTLAAYIEDCDNLIVFDAAELKSSPGTVQSFEGEDMDHFLGTAKRSPHEVGLLDLFDIARLTESLPDNRALIGIQPESMEWDMQPSASIADALPLATRHCEQILNNWRLFEPAVDDRHGDVTSKVQNA